MNYAYLSHLPDVTVLSDTDEEQQGQTEACVTHSLPTTAAVFLAPSTMDENLLTPPYDSLARESHD